MSQNKVPSPISSISPSYLYPARNVSPSTFPVGFYAAKGIYLYPNITQLRINATGREFKRTGQQAQGLFPAIEPISGQVANRLQPGRVV
jgi:hypothetical protein